MKDVITVEYTHPGPGQDIPMLMIYTDERMQPETIERLLRLAADLLKENGDKLLVPEEVAPRKRHLRLVKG